MHIYDISRLRVKNVYGNYLSSQSLYLNSYIVLASLLHADMVRPIQIGKDTEFAALVTKPIDTVSVSH
jgi:hypothetical protein